MTIDFLRVATGRGWRWRLSADRQNRLLDHPSIAGMDRRRLDDLPLAASRRAGMAQPDDSRRAAQTADRIFHQACHNA